MVEALVLVMCVSAPERLQGCVVIDDRRTLEYVYSHPSEGITTAVANRVDDTKVNSSKRRLTRIDSFVPKFWKCCM